MTTPRYTVLVAQSRDTGRFLLAKKDDLWQFLYTDWSEDWFDVISSNDTFLRATGQQIELVDFVLCNNKSLVPCHTWVDGEPLNPSFEYPLEWCSLFNFPEQIHPTVPKILRLAHFKEIILNPEYDE